MAKRKSLIAALVAVIIVLWPSTALALGVVGFDLYRPIPKNPDSAFHFNLKPGQSLEDRVMLKNTTTDTVQNLRIYAADGIPVQNGGISLKGRQEPRTGLARWIKLDSPEDVTLAPGEERSIWFRLAVPSFTDTSERFAGVVVERAEVVPGQRNGQFVINILPRAALLITQRLPGPAMMRLKIVAFDRSSSGKNTLFKLAVKNTGNVHVRPKGQIDIKGTFGQRSSIKLDRMPTIFPKTTSWISTPWKDTPWIGYFTARATVRYGKGQSDSRSIHFLLFPWWLLPVLLGLWLVARQQRKRRVARQLKEREAEQAAMAALQELAEEEPLTPVATAAPSMEEHPSKPKSGAAKAKIAKTTVAKTPRRTPASKTVSAGKVSVAKTPRKPSKDKTAPAKKTPGSSRPRRAGKPPKAEKG